MLGAAQAIELATQRLKDIISRPRDTTRFNAVDVQVHDTILASALGITNAISRLIKAATESQQEIVAQGKGSSSTQQFYKRNKPLDGGLDFGGQGCCFRDELADRVRRRRSVGHAFLEQLIVASNEVAAATAQLVAASRVKASLMSKTQDRLELAAKAVTEACKALVRQVKEITTKQIDAEQTDYGALGVHEFKVREMSSRWRFSSSRRSWAPHGIGWSDETGWVPHGRNRLICQYYIF